MRRIVLICICALIAAVFALVHFGQYEAQIPIKIGVPIKSLLRIENAEYKVKETTSITDSPFRGLYTEVVHKNTTISLGDALLSQDVITDRSGIVPKLVIFCYRPQQRQNINFSFDSNMLSKYTDYTLSNGAVYYEYKDLNELPTTDYTYVHEGVLIETFSVCNYIIYCANDSYLWAVLDPGISMDDQQVISDYMVKMAS